MLVYTTLFTLANKNPKENKYITMFYMWFSYLKRYGGLGSNDCVGLIVDEDTLSHMNSEGNQIFAYISEGVPFHIEISIMKRPANLSEGFSERYNMENFECITKHELNLHFDIDCLCIRNIHTLFNQIKSNENTFYAMTEHGYIYDNNYGGHLLEEGIIDGSFPAFSAGWYAWKHSASQREMFEAVSKGCLANAATPFYTVDQPFYIYELVTRIVSKKKSDLSVCILSKDIIPFNVYIEDVSLKNAYFVNFAGEPGVENSHFNKIFSFMCMDFSTSPVSTNIPVVNNCWTTTKFSTPTSKVFDTRNEMLEYYCNKCINPTVLEIGVFRGDFLSFLVDKCNISYVDAVDIFEGAQDSGDVDGNNLIRCDLDKSFNDLSEKYKDMPHVNIIKSDSSTYLSRVKNYYYDIIYIDGDHSYNGVKKDLENAFFKVKNGGYIMGHDYEINVAKGYNLYNFGVKKAVDEFCVKYNQKILAKAMDGCVSYCIKIENETIHREVIASPLQTQGQEQVQGQTLHEEDKKTDTSELLIHASSYIMEPYQILSYDCRKKDGILPIVKIGKKCSIGINCSFVMSQHLTDRFTTSPSKYSLFAHKKGNLSSFSKGDIIIMNDVWIGANVTILDGITIGNGSVIAAGSIVVKDVPPYAIVGGNPAKVIKYRFSQDIIDELEGIHFWDLPLETIESFDIHTKDIRGLIQEVRDKLYTATSSATVAGTTST